MAKKPAAAKGGGGSDAWLIGCAVLALALGGVAWWLNGRLGSAREELSSSIDQYERMKKMKAQVLDLTKGGKEQLQVPETGSDDITAYIGQVARRVNLPQGGLSIGYEGSRKSGSWREEPITVTVRGTRDAPVPHNAFVDFVSTIEKERPYLKSKNLSYTLAGMDYQTVQVTISLFRRE